jgi:hypothetical protein
MVVEELEQGFWHRECKMAMESVNVLNMGLRNNKGCLGRRMRHHLMVFATFRAAGVLQYIGDDGVCNLLCCRSSPMYTSVMMVFATFRGAGVLQCTHQG